MMQYINGRKYDSNKTKKIGEWENSAKGDEYVFESLHRKRTGEYFLYGRGGASSRYANARRGHFSEGESIILLSYDEAEKWSKEHMPSHKYEELFGKSKNSVKKNITFHLQLSTINKIKRCAEKEAMSISDFVAIIIDEYEE